MGGFGSGNHWGRPHKKTTVEDCLRLDANRWMREGLLKEDMHLRGQWQWTYRSGNSFSINYEVETRASGPRTVRLFYSYRWAGKEEYDHADYQVRLTTTQPRFGGLRWWFICPLVLDGRPCNRRVGKLYLPPRCSYFGCRHCYGLTYTSCQESRQHDALYRSMAQNLGWDIKAVRAAMKRLHQGKD